MNSYKHRLPQPISPSQASRKDLAVSTRQIANTAALLSILVSFTVIIGWVANWPILTHWNASSRGMVPETAVAVLVAGFGLLMSQKTEGWPIRIIGALLFIVGLVNELAHNFKGSYPSLAFLQSTSFQMAHASALIFVLLGLGLILVSRANTSVVALWTIAILGNSVIIVGLITILAQLSGLTTAPWWSSFFLRITLPTAVSCCTLGTALLSIFLQRSKGMLHQFSITAAVLAILGLLLLFAGVDAAVIADSNSLLTSQIVGRRASDELRSIQFLTGNVRKAESGQRGYLLTDDPRYLSDFLDGERGVDQALLQTTLEDTELIETVKRKFKELKRTIELERTGHHADAVALVKASEGLRLMDLIDLQANLISDQRQKRVAIRRDERQQTILSISRTILWSYGIAVLFALGALLLIAGEMKRRSRIEAELRETEIRINTELQKQTVRAEEANRAKSNFLASMSHEIRTPMNAILGMADMLWETELSQTQRHYVEIFRRAGGNLLTLINDILNLSKIESGSFSLERVSFDLGEVIEQLMEILAPKAEAKGIGLSAHIEPSTCTSVIGDPVRLQQVLLNLLGNALKFTERGCVSLHIQSHSKDGQATLEFEISDTGIGISADNLATIFEDFTQAESSITRRFGGTGLGLGISRRIVHLMGGQLQVRSELGKGSTFFFHVILPIDFDQRASRSDEFDEIVGKKVLIVDNNGTNRAILGGMCAAWGMSVKTCANGHEAIKAVGEGFSDQGFSVALVDRMMPAMDGFETAIQILKIDPQIAILIISSDSLPGDITRCRELGFCGHLLKPVRSAALLRQVVKALTHSGETNVTATVDEPIEVLPAVEAQRPLRVLVAEDSEDNRFLLEAYCAGTNYRLSFVYDGARAVEAYAKDAFDLVVMDIQMPVMDGLTATRAIRTAEENDGRRRIPILAMTANALPEDVIASQKAGCDTHLAKPISKKNFLHALDSWKVKLDAKVHPAVQITIPAGLEEAAARYLEARRKELSTLQELSVRSEFAELKRLSHNLKGTGKSYGFPEITVLGGEIELASLASDLDRVSNGITALSNYVESVAELILDK